MISDPQNMGLDTVFVLLSAKLAALEQKADFPVMAVLICIKNIRGTFCCNVNKAIHFVDIFSYPEMYIRSIFQGVQGNPFSN